VIAALLLAAGASRRFGDDKLVQDLDGKPVVRRSAEALLGPPIDAVYVVVPREHTLLQRALSRLRVTLVVNADSAGGIGTSIAAGVAALGPSVNAVVIALADEPAPSHTALDQVTAAYHAGARIVAPSFRGVPGHPVLFDRSLFAELRALDGDVGARSVIERHSERVALVTLDEPAPEDIDIPDDLARLRARTQNSSPSSE